MLRWGATREEAAEALPGDDRTPHPATQSTRAITIEAPPEQVWPWIVQMGIERAGFYTHDAVERLLFHARYVEGRHSATRIHRELQDLKVGDPIPYGAGVYAYAHEIEPFRHLVAAETFVLRPLPGNRTRLIVRYRGMGFIRPALGAVAPDAPLPSRLLQFAGARIPGVDLVAGAIDNFIADPLHHYMEVGMLRGIKDRAEGSVPDPRGSWRRLALIGIKSVHTVAFFTIGLAWPTSRTPASPGVRTGVPRSPVPSSPAKPLCTRPMVSAARLPTSPSGSDRDMPRLPTSISPAGSKPTCHRSLGPSSLSRWRCMRGTCSNRAGASWTPELNLVMDVPDATVRETTTSRPTRRA
jgi:hypothetical protein